jgi:molybdopterin converting factor small subunit
MGGVCEARPLATRQWMALPARRARRARAARRAPAERGRRAPPATRCDAGASAGVLGDLLHGASAAADAAAAVAAEAIPNIVRDAHPYEYRIHTDTHVFPGLDQYASVGVHFNIPAVLASTALVTSAGVLLVSQLWERVWKERVFPDEAAAAEEHPTVLCGVDCSAYPVFSEAKVVRAAAFAERWHHGQYRRSGEPYVTHSIQAAVILAAMLPANASGRKYVDAIVACILHDVVDDTDCELDDVEAEFGSFVAKLVSDVSTLGKLPQILRRSQRRRSESVAVERGDGEREVLGMDMAELASLRRLLWFQVNDPRCFLIKFADRLHNMRTIYALDPVKARFVAVETLQVWCYFAEQVGMFGAKAEMEDLSFATLDSEAFRAVINARVDEWVLNEFDADARKAAKAKKAAAAAAAGKPPLETAPARPPRADEASEAEASEEESPFPFAWTWEPPTGADVQMFFERVIRGENAGTPRADDARATAAERRRMYAEARAAVREEERVKRAKPMTPAQEELRALLGCVPPFDLLRSSGRNARSAAALAAALAAADAATAATAGGRPAVGGASLAASLAALRACESTTLRVLQLDALAPGLRVDITGRLKSAYSTHLKMRRKGVPFGKVCDARAVRVVLGECGDAPGTKEEVTACYALLEAIHKLYRPVPGEYDDYVAKPKASGYQSLHTAVVGPDGALLEFQVRTRAMHEAAEFGNAAHWLYKDFMSEAAGGGVAPEGVLERFTEASMGQPVHITRGGDRGARLSAGVVCWAEGSRAHVVEPRPGDTYAPGLANSAGIVDTAEWVAMGLHTALLSRARDACRVQPRQTGPGYAILEFARCSDGRWHEIDSFGRKLATVADLLDADDLVDALRSADADAEDEDGDEARVDPVVEAAVLETVVERPAELGRSVATVSAGAEETPVVSDEDVRVRVASPDDEDVNRRVQTMQSALQSYLLADDVAVVSEVYVDFDNVIVEDNENDAEETETIVGLGRFEGTAAAESRPPASVLAARALTADEALARARAELAEQSEARERAAKVERLRARARASGEPAPAAANAMDADADSDPRDASPIFAIAQARIARGTEKPAEYRIKPVASEGAIFDAEEAAQLQLELDMGAGFVTRASDERERSRVSLNDDNVLVIAWVDKDDGEGRQPEMFEVPRGATAAQLGSRLAAAEKTGAETDGDPVEGAEDLVNVNMQMVPSDTPLKQGDQVFLGD